jgi:hypothetical protein
MARLSGLPIVKISAAGTGLLRFIGLFSPVMRSVADSSYQFTAPFVIDDSAARDRFGLEPAAWEDTLRETVAHAQQVAAAGTAKAGATR